MFMGLQIIYNKFRGSSGIVVDHEHIQFRKIFTTKNKICNLHHNEIFYIALVYTCTVSCNVKRNLLPK